MSSNYSAFKVFGDAYHVAALRVQLPDGVLRIIASRDRAFAAQGHLCVGLLAGATSLRLI
jgi:two-component system osmolarity sensor histidine kinase EnvZ